MSLIIDKILEYGTIVLNCFLYRSVYLRLYRLGYFVFSLIIISSSATAGAATIIVPELSAFS
jgi:hypothetical protein